MIPDHFTTQFGKNFTNAVQQSTSRFKGAAIIETGVTGEAKTHNLVLPINDNESTGERVAQTVLQELDTEKRWNTPRMFDLGTVEPFWDEILLSPTILPGGKHIEGHTSAYNRRLDTVFVEGLFGENQKGKTGNIAANIPSENIVDEQYNGTGSFTDSSLTVDKILEAKRILIKNESYGQDAMSRGVKLWGTMDADMEQRLLLLANASGGSAANRLFSRDYMPPVLDENGRIKFFLGVNWIIFNNLPKDPTDADVTFAGIWTSDAVHLDIWKDITTTVDRRSDLKNAVQFFSQYSFNACRSEDKKVVKIGCHR